MKQYKRRMVIVLIGIVGLVGCHWWDREHRTPTTPGAGGEGVLNYAQMEDGSAIVDGQQINWVVSEWGSIPYEQWMYVEVNQQDAVGQPPGEHQVPVQVHNVVLRFSELPDEVQQIIIGVKTVRDDADQTFTERGRFTVVNGSVSIPLDYGDLVSYFGVTHYSVWFQALGGKNARGVDCGQLALSGVMPGGQLVMLQKNFCFGTNPAPVSPVPVLCVVTTEADDVTIPPTGSLRQKLSDHPCCTTIKFASDVSAITLAGTQLEIPGTCANLTIDGGSGVTISGNKASRVLYVESGANVRFRGLLIQDGNTTDIGGGIHNNGGAVTIEASTMVSGNTAGYGGGIFNEDDGTVTIEANTTVSGNTASYGSGIYNDGGTLTVNGAVSDNDAYDGGGIYIHDGTVTVKGAVSGNTADDYGSGGGIYIVYGMLTVNGEVNGNTAYFGGGIFNDGDGTVMVTGMVSHNTAYDGGGIYYDEGTATLTLKLGARVQNNTATSTGTGGGIYNRASGSGTAPVTGATSETVNNNTAATCNNFYDATASPECRDLFL